MTGDPRPIGVFDSGVGGLSVLAELRRLLPHEQLIYYADQANLPYGRRDAAEVRRLTTAAVERLLGLQVKLIVIACNTASSAALPHLRARFEVPFVGVEPPVKPACALSRNGRVGVLATSGTVQGGKLRLLIERVAGEVQVTTSPAPELVELVEAGPTEGPETVAVVRRALQPLIDARVDVVGLGCTHFAFLLPQIEQLVGPDVVVMEPAAAVARQAARLLNRHELAAPANQAGSVCYRGSAGDARVEAAARRLLGSKL